MLHLRGHPIYRTGLHVLRAVTARVPNPLRKAAEAPLISKNAQTTMARMMHFS
jgi:hypothetical protein